MILNTIASKISIARLRRVNRVWWNLRVFILLFPLKQNTDFFLILFHMEMYHSKHVRSYF